MIACRTNSLFLFSKISNTFWNLCQHIFTAKCVSIQVIIIKKVKNLSNSSHFQAGGVRERNEHKEWPECRTPLYRGCPDDLSSIMMCMCMLTHTGQTTTSSTPMGCRDTTTPMTGKKAGKPGKNAGSPSPPSATAENEPRGVSRER